MVQKGAILHYFVIIAQFILLSLDRHSLYPRSDGWREGAPAGGRSAVQYAHRMALIGTVLKQKGHSRVLGASGSLCGINRSCNFVIGSTTKTYRTAAVNRKMITTLIKSPHL